MSRLYNRHCSHRDLPCTVIVYFNGTNQVSLSVLSTYGARQLKQWCRGAFCAAEVHTKSQV